jgi:hypothetical protein
METRLRYGLLALAVVDLSLGTFLLFWPGAWQELVHPWAMGTVFYPVQRLGAAWLGRALIACFAAGRGGVWITVLAGAWSLDLPGDILLAWSVADTGPLVAGVYLGHAALTVLEVHRLWRATREE